jgi:hypothetical protein
MDDFLNLHSRRTLLIGLVITIIAVFFGMQYSVGMIAGLSFGEIHHEYVVFPQKQHFGFLFFFYARHGFSLCAACSRRVVSRSDQYFHSRVRDTHV